MSFVNGALDSSPVALQKTESSKRVKASMRCVASRVPSASGKKRKPEFNHTSSSLLERNGVDKGGKRIRTVKRGGRENEGDERSLQQLPTISEKKKKETKPKVEEGKDETSIERFLRLSNSMGLRAGRCSEQSQAPLTPPVSYKTIQPKGSSERRAASEPPSPSNARNSPSPKSGRNTVTDRRHYVDLDNPFLETPVGLIRPATLNHQAPDTPDDLESETFGRKLPERVKYKNLAPGSDDETESRKELPPSELDSKGEKSYLTYVFKGKRIAVPNDLFNVPHDPREDLPPSHGNFRAPQGLKPQNLFPKAIFGREVKRNPRFLVPSNLNENFDEDDPFIERQAIRKRT